MNDIAKKAVCLLQHASIAEACHAVVDRLQQNLSVAHHLQILYLGLTRVQNAVANHLHARFCYGSLTAVYTIPPFQTIYT